VAFEPLPRNLAYLHEHLRLNALANCTVIPAAVGERPGRSHFRAAANPSMGALAPGGEVEVRVATLDDLAGQAVMREPDVIKMDIEGGELAALRGASSLLRVRRPIVILATHGAQIHKDCCRLLDDAGYALSALDGRTVEATDELIATPR
jgi:FkbM family methyltransferase